MAHLVRGTVDGQRVSPRRDLNAVAPLKSKQVGVIVTEKREWIGPVDRNPV